MAFEYPGSAAFDPTPNDVILTLRRRPACGKRLREPAEFAGVDLYATFWTVSYIATDRSLFTSNLIFFHLLECVLCASWACRLEQSPCPANLFLAKSHDHPPSFR